MEGQQLSTFTGKLLESKVRRYDQSSKAQKEVACTEILTVYNKYMVGVDLVGSYLGRHSITVESKWYFRLFYHLLDRAVINAWILYKENL